MRLKGFSTLSLRRDFTALKNNSRCVSSKSLVLCCSTFEQSGIRVGFAISKKVGIAVVRNKIRRRLRYALSSAICTPNGMFDRDYMLICRPKMAHLTFQEIERDLSFCIKKISTWATKSSSTLM